MLDQTGNDPYLKGTQGTMLERRDARKRLQTYNPLSAFGFMSDQEQSQAQLMNDQMEDVKALQLAQLNPLQSQVYQAHRAGTKLAQAINGLIGGKKTRGDDPHIDEFNKIVELNNGDLPTSYIQMGKDLVKRGDSRGIQMIQQGTKLQLDQNKELAATDQDIASAASSRASAAVATAGAKIGDVRNIQYGDQQQQQEVVDIKNGRPIWADVGTGGARSPKQTVQNLDDPRTASQEGAAYQKMTDSATMLKGAMDDMDYIAKEAASNPGAIGMQGMVVEKAYNIYQAAKNGIQYGILNKKVDPALQYKLDNAEKYLKDFDMSGIEKVGITNPAIQAQFIRLAFGLAATSQQGGRTISDRDVNQWMKTIGAGISDPRALAKNFNRIKYGLARDYVTGAEFNNFEKAPGLDYFRKVRDSFNDQGESTQAQQSGGMTPAQKARLEELRAKFKGTGN